MGSYRELQVWQRGMDLAVQVYGLARAFPPEERFGLTSQLTRAAASVPANVAEGSARGSAKDYARFLAIARGSLNETETYLLLAVRLKYVDAPRVAAMLQEIDSIGRMITAIRRRLS